tara:strand:- start:251 stop:1072 length:822 start_codon:yes stop_codon:yes gene_type:complete
MNQKKITELIIKNLLRNQDLLKSQFQKKNEKIETRFFVLDNLLPENIVSQINKYFLNNENSWREIKSLREKKMTTKQLDKFPDVIKSITFALQSKEVISIIEQITSINNLVADEKLYAGGLSIMRKGDFLNPHYDNSHDSERKLYRRLNLLYYVTSNWKLEYGGNLELWNKKVEEKVTIMSKYNRLVVMETNKYSWHSASRVIKEKFRCCISNYFFSYKSPNGEDYFHITGFHGRPRQYFRRIILPIDSIIRNNIRKLFSMGFSKRDYYKPSN